MAEPDPVRQPGPLWLVGLVVAVVVIGGTLWLAPKTPAGGRGAMGSRPPGTGILGPGDGRLSATPPSSPDPSTGATTPRAAGNPTINTTQATTPVLTVSSVVDVGLLADTVMVTVTNAGAHAQSWQSVSVRLGGVALLVRDVDPAVRYRAHGADHCFLAGPDIATVAAGEAVSFTFTVTELLGRTATMALDQPACA